MKISTDQLRSLSCEEVARRVEALLPPPHELPARSEIEYYGASDVISARIGLSSTPEIPPGLVSWHHGPNLPPLWGLADLDPPIPESELDYPFYMAPKQALRLIVQRKEEAFLSSLGSFRHLAVGAPFCYVEKSALPRLPNTLLAMPVHSFVSGRSEHNLDLVENYATYLESLRTKFALVCVCLYADDFVDKRTRNIYQHRGFPVVRGAGIKDRKSLYRIRRLFETFDYMTSNGIGSHVIYASSAGCRVFLTDHCLLKEKRPIWEKHPFYANRPNVLTNVLKWTNPAFLKQRWPWLYCGESTPVANTVWANEMLGMDNVRPPIEIARLFGWRFPFCDKPSRELFLKFAPLLGCDLPGAIRPSETTPRTRKKIFLKKIRNKIKSLFTKK